MGPSMKSSFNESIYSQRKYDVRNARNCAKKMESLEIIKRNYELFLYEINTANTSGSILIITIFFSSLSYSISRERKAFTSCYNISELDLIEMATFTWHHCELLLLFLLMHSSNSSFYALLTSHSIFRLNGYSWIIK